MNGTISSKIIFIKLSLKGLVKKAITNDEDEVAKLTGEEVEAGRLKLSSGGLTVQWRNGDSLLVDGKAVWTKAVIYSSVIYKLGDLKAPCFHKRWSNSDARFLTIWNEGSFLG